MTENFMNWQRGKYMQLEEVQMVPNKSNPKWPTLRHIIIKMAKFKDSKS